MFIALGKFVYSIFDACVCMTLSFLLSLLAMLLEPFIQRYKKIFKTQVWIEDISERLYLRAMRFVKQKK